MRTILLCIALALASPASAKKPKRAKAQAAPTATVEAPAIPPDSVELPCGYEPGAEHRYRIEKRSLRESPGQPPVTQGNATVLTLRVVSHTDAETVLDVAFSEQQLLAPPEDDGMQRLLERVAAVSDGVPVRVAVDHETSEPRVVGLDALMTAYGTVADEMKAVLRAEQPDLTEAQLAGIDAALANRDLVAASIAGDLQPLFGFTCGRVPIGELRYETELPNPLGMAPLPASGTIRGVVGERSVAFEVHEVLDPVKVLDQLRPVMEQMGVALPADARLDKLEIEIRTDLEVVVDRETGWPTQWSSERTGAALGSGRTDTVSVTRLD